MPVQTHSIIDGQGIRYQVESERDASWRFHIHHGEQVVGYMNCIEQPPVLLVGDFKIYTDVRAPESVSDLLWRKLLGLPQPVRNYRNRGLGTAMLGLLSDLARSAGFQRLEGWISDVDTAGNPELPHWYRRRGFVVTEGPGVYPHQLAAIRKEL